MNKRYKITLPTEERARRFGIKFEGQDTRTRLWLLGVAQGIDFANSAENTHIEFHVFFSTHTLFYFKCNSASVVAGIERQLRQYGCEVEEVYEELNSPSIQVDGYTADYDLQTILTMKNPI